MQISAAVSSPSANVHILFLPLGLPCERTPNYRLRRLPRIPLRNCPRDAARAVGVCLGDPRVDGGAFTANKSFGRAALSDRLKYMPKRAALAAATMPILREARVIRNRIFQP